MRLTTVATRGGAGGLVAVVLAIGGPADAQSVTPVPSTVQPAAPCTGQRYHQFDFWIGEWEVTDPNGRLLGHDVIRAIQGGCVLEEHWQGAGGDVGTSLTVYDFTRDVWHQTWVSGPQLLVLEGRFENGKLILAGTTRGRDGETVHQRITWTRVSAHEVTQVWEMSGDTTTWTTAFRGTYRRTG